MWANKTRLKQCNNRRRETKTRQLRTTISTFTLWPLNKEWQGQHSQFLRCLYFHRDFESDFKVTFLGRDNIHHHLFSLLILLYLPVFQLNMLIIEREIQVMGQIVAGLQINRGARREVLFSQVWNCENESVNVKMWKCANESVKVWKWKCENESVKVWKWNCESVKVKV